jgi:hypothetical protein
MRIYQGFQNQFEWVFSGCRDAGMEQQATAQFIILCVPSFKNPVESSIESFVSCLLKTQQNQV